jgi:hypothetical protein
MGRAKSLATSRHLNRTHRQKLIWQVGFLFWIEIEAGAAGKIFAEPLPQKKKATGENKQWAFLKFERKT